MLELPSRDRLQQHFIVREQPEPVPARIILMMRWTVDGVTGRPVCRWQESQERGSPA